MAAQLSALVLALGCSVAFAQSVPQGTFIADGKTGMQNLKIQIHNRSKRPSGQVPASMVSRRAAANCNGCKMARLRDRRRRMERGS